MNYKEAFKIVSFLKENGFPATIHIETQDLEDVTKNFKGYHSVITDETGKQLAQFCHTDLRARIHWANGYFTALRNGVDWNLPLSIN